MCSIIGCWPTRGSIGLGRFEVCGRRRVPSPPAMITAFMPRKPGGAAALVVAQRSAAAGLDVAGSPPGTGQRQPREAGHPGDDPDRLLPGRRAVAQEEGRVGEHEAERPRLAHPEHVDPRRTQYGEEDHHGRDEHLPRDGGQPEPQGHGPIDHHRDHGGADEDAVGRRVEDLAQGRDLVVAAGHEAVDPVRGAQDGEQDGRRRRAVQAEEKPQEHREAKESHQRDEVRCGQDPVEACIGTFLVDHGPSLRGRPLGGAGPPPRGVCQSGASAVLRTVPPGVRRRPTWHPSSR